MRTARLAGLVLASIVFVGCSRISRARAYSPTDSLALADSAHRACHSLTGDDRTSCYQRMLDPLVTSSGVKIAMGTLNRLGVLDDDVRNDGHVYAHGIGIAAGKAGGANLAPTFASCTEIFQSGCYHGVIQAYFERVHDIDTASVNGMCATWSTPDGDRWLRFQCVHGIGHGLTMFYAHDLPEALSGCDLLKDDWDRESCYGGAFMENVVNATAPHHHPGAALVIGPAKPDTSGHAGMAGMDMGGAHHDHEALSTRAAFKPLDSLNMQYPCSALEQRYLNQCYQMQTSVMLHFNHGDIGAAARDCLRAPGPMRYVCHQSLGRDVSSYSRMETAEAVRMCSLAEARFQPWCHVGVVKNFIDVTARAEDGIAYCEHVPGESNKAMCYDAVGEQIATLKVRSGDRAALCAKVEEAFRAACRYGAQLESVRPRAIPTIS